MKLGCKSIPRLSKPTSLLFSKPSCLSRSCRGHLVQIMGHDLGHSDDLPGCWGLLWTTPCYRHLVLAPFPYLNLVPVLGVHPFFPPFFPSLLILCTPSSMTTPQVRPRFIAQLLTCPFPKPQTHKHPRVSLHICSWLSPGTSALECPRWGLLPSPHPALAPLSPGSSVASSAITQSNKKNLTEFPLIRPRQSRGPATFTSHAVPTASLLSMPMSSPLCVTSK